MKFPFHHIMLAAYPPLFLYSVNLELVAVGNLWPPLVLHIGGALLVWAAFIPLLKDVVRSAVLASLWLILFSTYGHLYGILDRNFSPWVHESGLGTDAGQTLHWIVGTMWVSLFLLVPLVCERLQQRTIAMTSLALHWFSCVLIVIPAFTILFSWGNSSDKPAEISRQSWDVVTPRNNAEYPDLYLIALDGYAREDILEEHYQFENQDFLNALEHLGFQIPGNSRSNYTWTLLSLPSVMNFNYLHELVEYPEDTAPSISPLIHLFRANHVSRILRERGLAHLHLQSTYAATMRNPYADRELGCSGRFKIDFYRLLVETSFLRIWSSAVINDLAECHMEQFERLESISKEPYAKFVFAHFILPHPPYVFDEQGNTRDRVAFSDQFETQAHLWSMRREYVDQMKFLNLRLLQIVDSIISNSQHEPIILIISDHGPKLTNPEGMPEPDYRNARFANLVAAHLPGDNLKLPDNITLVNLFRYVLNEYFDEDFKYLENRYFEAPTGNPFEQTEVRFDKE